MTRKINEEEFISVAKNSQSMREASIKLNMPFTTFKRHAKRLEIYETNQAGKGITKKGRPIKLLKDVFSNEVMYISTHKLKERLFKEGYKDKCCEICGLVKWNELDISLELHHKDGNRMNNSLDNLMICCPNCHAQQDHYRGSNTVNNKDRIYVPDSVIMEALKTTNNIRQALKKVGLAPAGGNYQRVYALQKII